jgi:uncharacterized protein YeaO (DUF488 family)
VTAAARRGKRTAQRTTKRRLRASIRIKRIYDPPARNDGTRILIDRLWPRGLAKAELKRDGWAKELAPSPALRRWYGHQPEHFAEFRRRYLAELEGERERLDELRGAVRRRTVTLLTATRELDLSHATVLREVLQAKG